MTQDTKIKIYCEEDFLKMRKAGIAAAHILDFIADYIEPNITTEELDQLCHNEIVSHGHIPAPLNYKGYPKSTCISVNHVVCHGIPGSKKLENGDILNIDVTVIVDGWYGDTSRMYYVGTVPTKARRLCEITYEAMMLGIEQVRPGQALSQIGKTIQEYVRQYGYSVVRDFCGHGIGKNFHMPPNILHYYEPKSNLTLEEGMFFTVEPMINAGKSDIIILQDRWTAVTRDRTLSAQFEHTIGVTKNGAEIFTTSPKGHTLPPYPRS